MQVSLLSTEGPHAGEDIVLAPGQSISVGRTDASDRHFPDDLQMSGRHFELVSDGQSCRVRDLQSTNGTFVNEQRVSDQVVQDGDFLKAGNSRFMVSISHVGAAASPPAAAAPTPPIAAPLPAQMTAPAAPLPSPATPTPPAAAGVVAPPAPVPPPAAAPPAAAAQPAPGAAAPQAILTRGHDLPAEPKFWAATALEVCSQFALDEAAQPFLDAEVTPAAFAERLRDNGLLEDAMTFLAFALPKRAAVGWAGNCVRQTQLTPQDERAAQVCEQWLLDPSEENRRAAGKAAEQLEYGTAASWVAAAAFWSSGSMTPAEAPPLAPADDLCAKAVAGAVKLAAAASGDPLAIPDQQKSFVDLGIRLGS